MEGKIVIMVDFENNSDFWWNCGGLDLWTAITGDPSANCVEITPVAAKAWLHLAEQIPGWADGPDYARHPVIVTDGA